MAKSTTTKAVTEQVPAIIPNTGETPDDIMRAAVILTGADSAKLEQADILGIVAHLGAADDAAVKVTTRNTVGRYFLIGYALAVTLWRKVGGVTGDPVPDGDTAGSKAAMFKMLDRIGYDVTDPSNLGKYVLGACFDAWSSNAPELFPAWSDVKASDPSLSVKGSTYATFYGNGADNMIRWAVASKANRVLSSGAVIGGSRFKGKDGTAVPVADLPAEVRETLPTIADERDAKRAATDAALAAAKHDLLTAKSTKALIGGDITVGTINLLSEADITKLVTYLAARRQLIKGETSQHDAGAAAVKTVTESAPAKAPRKRAARPNPVSGKGRGANEGANRRKVAAS